MNRLGSICLIAIGILKSTNLFALPTPVATVASHLVGIMDTSAQAAVNSERANVQMVTCRVKLQDTNASVNIPDSIFLYQEQALSHRLNQPYRQRFLRLALSKDGKMVESKAFKPIVEENWIGFCNQREDRRLVSVEEIIDVDCSVFLVPQDGNIVGTTQAGGCSVNFRGAVNFTNTIILHSDGMETWDRGFDAQGNQIWGAKDESYQFLWQE